MNKKFHASLLVLALLLSMSTLAVAAVKDFPKFSIDVPAGWTSSQDGPTVILIADDKTASISITVGDTEGETIETLAKAFTQELKGSAPTPKDGGYTFTFKSGAVESNAFITGEGKEYALFVVTGTHASIPAIMESLKEK